MQATHPALVFDPALIRRFDVLGPRYTSYPTADRFSSDFDELALRSSLGKRAQGGFAKPLSLYFHIPFCNTICYYCGCNKIITKDQSKAARYIAYLEREMALQVDSLDGPRQVLQMHWGGGTPTFLSDGETQRLMAAIRGHFSLIPSGEYSIEVDPRKVSRARVELLGREGFNRMSVGIQDFDPKVQRAVNRVQSLEETAVVISAARNAGFHSVSTDLMYGLPHQSVETFARTLEHVIALAPDRVSLYNYAHLPSRFMPQRRISEADLPSAEEKLEILAHAIHALTAAGFVFIGMDHFARPNDELAVAQRQGRLHRNFQGYSTYAECDLLAFGVSAIGHVAGSFAQNARDIEDYYASLDRGELPVIRGWLMSRDDLVRNAIIQSLMCHFELSIEAIEMSFGIDFQREFKLELEELEGLEAAGLVRLQSDWIEVTDRGRLLVRAVAMVFDRYLREDREKSRYSRLI